MNDQKRNIPKDYATSTQLLREQIISDIRSLNASSIEEIQRCKNEDEVVELARCYYHLRVTKEAIEAAMSQYITRTFEILKGRDYPDMLETRGLRNVPLEDVKKVIGTSTRTTVTMHDKPACMEWLRNYEETLPDGTVTKPYAALITETVHAGTLSSTAKELIEQGKDFPESVTIEGEEVPLFETKFMNNTTWRKLPDPK